ncbi:Wall-associated receptor kinase 2 [Acorus gramineus]|uniref:Wall-associated receptor kinase 2 n=1 Tax=Acorus gramineus TaxID=55184 RepID=A0AAV9B073_ACOGR|nr:Wall-associated receptor kinase 2 [Acorus gramineus]
MGLQMLLFQFMLLITTAASQSLPGCPSKCGAIDIPYPFGIGEGCFRENFKVTCNETFNPPKPFISTGNLDFTKISIQDGLMYMTQFVAYDCYNKSGWYMGNVPSINLPDHTYTFSNTRNVLTAMGCDTVAYITGPGEGGFSTGCVSVCNNVSVLTSGSCSGMGCCQTSIPEGVKWYKAHLQSFQNHSNVLNFNPCSYAFLVEKDWFTFNGASDLGGRRFVDAHEQVPLVLDWAIGEQTCEEAMGNTISMEFACRSNNSDCYDSSNGPGYRCNCSKGYTGNPYLVDGCQDIDECSDPSICKGVCRNTQGSFVCECPRGKHSDDPKMYDCVKKQFPVLRVALVISIPFASVLAGLLFCFGLQRRKIHRLREKLFRQHGGLLLEREISSHPGIAFKIFTKEDLERATSNFDKDQVLGEGGQGMVYKGVLSDRRVVAVKKSMVVTAMQNQQFGNEMLILSQVNHKNVVKLLGCCLEVEIPMLVYEFIPNGTLFQLIHGGRRLTLKARLRIASETACAIAYLHSEASPPIIHGDVKSLNILLDDNYTAKVSDFGASKLTPMDKDMFATFMQGTWGYLDPECLLTGILTEKSDVYSFGVVLVELLTRRKAVLIDGPEKDRNLSNLFVSSMKEDRLMDVLDRDIVDEGRMDLLREVSLLAKRCLNVQGEERPTMKEVAAELEGLAVTEVHPWVVNNPEETENLINKSSDSGAGGSTGFFSLEKRAMLSIEVGR